ncbi:S53 family peptidase [Jatrophihabitans sp. DSM 45814]
MAIPDLAAAATPTVIPNSHPSWATPGTEVAATAGSSRITFDVYLRTRDEAAAEAQAASVSNPASASYGRYLTAAQVRAQYAASDATVRSVQHWLASSGFVVGSTAANNAYVEATGTAAQIQSAFAVHLNTYAVKGKRLRAASADLKIPQSVASAILAVSGLNQSVSTPLNSNANPSPAVVAPPAGFRNAKPCGAYYGQQIDTTDPAYNGKHLPYAPCGYKPGQLRSAYGLDTVNRSGINGRGQTVAIVDAFASPTLFADAATYAKRNDPSNPLSASQFSQLVYPPTPGQEAPDQCDAAGWYGEQTLDVEAVHAMAPGAHILYVGGADCQDNSLDAALNAIVAGHLADIVTNSYGDEGEDLPADEIAAFNQIAVQAALEGITLTFSSGDSGDEAAAIGHPEADFSASDPWVTAVGGTSTGIGANGKRVVETGWQTERSTLTEGVWGPASYLYGSGGGTSKLFAEPFYQKGIVPTALARENQVGGKTGRVVPDISMDADPNTGMLIGQTQTFPDGVYYDQFRIGGTSLASPLFAGLIAVSNQLDHFKHGFLNPLMYQVTSRVGAVDDVRHVSGGVVRVDFVNGTDASDGLATSVRTFDSTSLTIHTTAGYDNVTGLGTPNGLRFLALS